ncbi:hypothetical protein M3T53_00695 [Actinomyces sp. B33]|uniref:hypothetical protein n=1 Tax=Actinomyces sp. B33 TaxID=2942131 RepID=UPI0023416B93|nr:hypothetical protein [Actinomyces sp. B33]MDC4232235.1 hypothetical protein [Actinomyces sp. B33]
MNPDVELSAYQCRAAHPIGEAEPCEEPATVLRGSGTRDWTAPMPDILSLKAPIDAWTSG